MARKVNQTTRNSKVMYEKDFVFTISPFVANWLQEQEIKPNRAERRAKERKEGGKRQLLTRRKVPKGKRF